MIRISRPCYDKYHRCPGWAGGGMKFAKKDRCNSGSVRTLKGTYLYNDRLWKYKLNKCETCGLIVLPYVIRYFDPTMVKYIPSYIIRKVRNFREWWQDGYKFWECVKRAFRYY